MRKLANWGNYPVVDAKVCGFSSTEELQQVLSVPNTRIAYGNGRSYGDASLNDHVVLMRRYNNLLSFDESSGELCCQSGVLFSEILDVFVPRGWFLPVTPGTKFLTVGGAIAADVHGKNHHLHGSFGQHIIRMEVMRSDGSIVVCSPSENSEFFTLTIGGMGLTGIILSATFRLRKVSTAYVREERIRAANLDEIMDCFEESHAWTYSVAWIDCLAKGDKMGRSIMMRGEHAIADELLQPARQKMPLVLKPSMKIDVPFDFPNVALNHWTMKAFNVGYYNLCRSGKHTSIRDYNQFFYPLDAVLNWNRIYGKRGFTQYQFVIPKEAGRKGLRVILKRISDSGLGSFLAVLKLFGTQDSFMSFPMEGYTLALDFPISLQAMDLFKALDALVCDFGGRLYLAKDCRMSEEMFMKTYPNAADFREAIALLNEGESRFASLLSKRVGITN